MAKAWTESITAKYNLCTFNDAQSSTCIYRLNLNNASNSGNISHATCWKYNAHIKQTNKWIHNANRISAIKLKSTNRLHMLTNTCITWDNYNYHTSSSRPREERSTLLHLTIDHLLVMNALILQLTYYLPSVAVNTAMQIS